MDHLNPLHHLLHKDSSEPQPYHVWVHKEADEAPPLAPFAFGEMVAGKLHKCGAASHNLALISP